jgi:MHS family proline/betaine transporter-like MFS transporter
MMSAEALDGWGWRIPFLLGLLVGVVGYFLRRDIVEAPRLQTSRRLPVVEAVRDHTPLLLRLVALSALKLDRLLRRVHLHRDLAAA